MVIIFFKSYSLQSVLKMGANENMLMKMKCIKGAKTLTEPHPKKKSEILNKKWRLGK